MPPGLARAAKDEWVDAVVEKGMYMMSFSTATPVSTFIKGVQEYLAYSGVLGRWTFSYERGTPVRMSGNLRQLLEKLDPFLEAHMIPSHKTLQVASRPLQGALLLVANTLLLVAILTWVPRSQETPTLLGPRKVPEHRATVGSYEGGSSSKQGIPVFAGYLAPALER